MLSIVIINYKSAPQTISLIQSILESDPFLPIEIVVVDNASKDGSADKIERHLPFSQIIRNEVNQGYSAAVNQALEQTTGTHVLLIHPCIELLTKRCLTLALEQLKQLGNRTILGIHLQSASGKTLPTIQDKFPGIRSILGRKADSAVFKQRRTLSVSQQSTHNKSGEAFLMKGQFLLFSKSIIEPENMRFNDLFYQFGADLEWGYRMRQSGMKFYFNHELKAQLGERHTDDQSIPREAQQICGEWLFVRIARGRLYAHLYFTALKLRMHMDRLQAWMYEKRVGQLNEKHYRRKLRRKLIRFGLSKYAQIILKDPEHFKQFPLNLYQDEQALFESLK